MFICAFSMIVFCLKRSIFFFAIEDELIAPFPIFDGFGDAGKGSRGDACGDAYFGKGLVLEQHLGRFDALEHSVELGDGAKIREEGVAFLDGLELEYFFE